MPLIEALQVPPNGAQPLAIVFFHSEFVALACEFVSKPSLIDEDNFVQRFPVQVKPVFQHTEESNVSDFQTDFLENLPSHGLLAGFAGLDRAAKGAIVEGALDGIETLENENSFFRPDDANRNHSNPIGLHDSATILPMVDQFRLVA